MCNLSYATTQICSYMCRMQLNFNCKRQLQNPKFLVVQRVFNYKTTNFILIEHEYFTSYHNQFETCNYICRNPTLREVWGRYSHSRKWDFRVLRDSQKLRTRLQGSKHLASRCSLHHWKALKESYKFALDLAPIGGWSEKLWTPKVSRVQTGTISGLHFGSPGTKNHLSVGAVE